MSFFDSGTVPFWGIALLLITVSATAIAGLWPPLHYRRLVTAVALALVALSYILVDRIPSLRLPMQVFIIAECEVLLTPSFQEDMRKLDEEPILVGEIGLLVLAAGSDNECSADPPAIPGLQVSKNRPLDRNLAIKEAKQFLDADRPRHWAAWPRHLARDPRIVLAHTPDSPLAPTQSRGMSPEESVPLPDGRQAELYHKSYGRVPFRSLRVTVTPAAITEEDASRGIMIELADPRLRDATHLKVTFSHRTVDESAEGECFVSPSDPVPKEMALSGDGSLEVERMSRFFARLDRKPQDRESRLDVFWKEFFSLSGCKGLDAWIAFDLELSVTLDTGGVRRVIGDRRTVMVPILPTAGLALVTPEGSLKARAAARGWELGASLPGHGFDGGRGLTDLLEFLFDELKQPACQKNDQKYYCTAISSKFLQLTERCWFKGVKDAQKRSKKFKDCLDRTHRLAIVGLDASQLGELDKKFSINETVQAGRINVMVAAPAYGISDVPPVWAPVLTTGLTTLRTEPRVHLLISTRDTLRMKARGKRSGLAAQKEFINNVVTHGGRIGPSERKYQCVRGEKFSQEEGGLAWFAYPRVPTQASDMTPLHGENARKHEPRLKGMFRSQRFGHKHRSKIGREPGDYTTNIVCNSPVLRLDRGLSSMKERQELDPEAAIPRAVLTVFAEDDKHVGLQYLFRNKSHPCSIDEKAFEKALKQFATAGGDVLILPVEDSIGIGADERVLKAVIGNNLVNLEDLTEQLRRITRPYDSVHLLSRVLNKNGEEDATVVKAFSDFLKERWQQDRRLVGAFVGDGALSDRRDVCVPNLSQRNDARWDIGDGCAFTEGKDWASALNRLAATPEQTRLLDPTKDPFVTGRWRLCTGDEIAHTRPHGLGRTSALGFSPFARDLLAPDLSYPNGTRDLLRSGQCYLQEQGRDANTVLFNNRYVLGAGQSLPIETRGGLKLLEHFTRFALIDRPLDAPRVHSIVVDPVTGNLDVTAVANLSSAWVWSPSAELSNGDDVSVLFTAFDRRTGLARFSISSRAPVADLLRMRLYQPLPASEADTSSPDPVLVPVNFMGETAPARSATRRAPFYKAPVFPFDGSTIAILGILGATLVMFSPLARRWHVAEELARSVIGESPSNDAFERTARAAPLFSLQAGLAEWGMHPGTPAAIRSFGLPAGLRRWRSGDQGGAIRMGTLYPLVARQLSLPPRLPEVRLRTASEAADVLILIEGNGALLTPRARRAPGKAVFAARFSAFLGHAVRLSHGAAEILRLGLQPLERLEPEDTEKAILDALHSAPTHTPPSEALAGQPLSGRLVYYVCDGLSINRRHLLALADDLVAEGSQLRIAPIISRDDADNIGLRRDPRDGAFDDDTETPPDLILARRDALLEDIAAVIARRQASLVVLDSALDTQSLLERMNETEFLT